MIGRIPILDVSPLVDCGRWPAKAVVGESVPVRATVFREGHDAVNANVVLRGPGGEKGPWTPMRPVQPGTDRWEAEIMPTAVGRWTFLIEAWGDPYATWRHDAEIKIPAGQDVELVLAEGARLLTKALRVVPRDARPLVKELVGALGDPGLAADERLAAGLDRRLLEVLAGTPLRDFVTASARCPLQVDRKRALYGSWYEFFPRSEGATLDPPKSGSFATAMDRLPAVADMAFDIVYLPPIHPIGRSFRKGANNTLEPGPDDPGSPWAIGSAEGGHDAIHPDLGTMEDFDAFVARTRELGMEIALDLALQCSPDHPWVTEHPEWFTTRVDGTIAYAENPPKKYQDIFPVNFDNDLPGITAEVLRIIRLWMDHGVRVFRVDNPHTKPVAFWEAVLADIRSTDPDVLFLAEAFTRPAMLRTLAKVGFHQSYTYFTWRNGKAELEAYLTELSRESVDYLRPNFFVNTPDILHAYLQYGGPAAFKARAVLAALLSPTWGVYSGFELGEATAVRPGSEEYLNSEKYSYRPRDWDGAELDGRSMSRYLRALNRLRRRHPALQRLRNLSFHQADSPDIIVFSKRDAATGDVVLAVVNIDPHAVHETTVKLDMPALGLGWSDGFVAHDEVTGGDFWWSEYNYVRLSPFAEPAHIFTLRPAGA